MKTVYTFFLLIVSSGLAYFFTANPAHVQSGKLYEMYWLFQILSGGVVGLCVLSLYNDLKNFKRNNNGQRQ